MLTVRVCSQLKTSWKSETGETGDKNCDVTDDIFRAPYMFCEEGLGNFNAKDVELFRNGSVHESITWKSWLLWNKWIL